MGLGSAQAHMHIAEFRSSTRRVQPRSCTPEARTSQVAEAAAWDAKIRVQVSDAQSELRPHTTADSASETIAARGAMLQGSEPDTHIPWITARRSYSSIAQGSTGHGQLVPMATDRGSARAEGGSLQAQHEYMIVTYPKHDVLDEWAACSPKGV
ncbi:hypothetical protein BD310DRAFT_902282 [Dichomitus squalens]|uniref:Uncharacterized protein n=1 Tax=Dichomitus squalens TaxID=114155 RepID=A0A4Q9QF81_9APHY|nr:hypothetical protein BD310DRAFT_902282 [Dichomitus squalens]